jgi:hypothetical protein
MVNTFNIIDDGIAVAKRPLPMRQHRQGPSSNKGIEPMSKATQHTTSRRSGQKHDTIPRRSVSPDPVFRAIAAYHGARERHHKAIDEAGVIERKMFKLINRQARKRMATRIKFERAHPDFQFKTSQEELFQSFRMEELRKLQSTPEYSAALRSQSKTCHAESGAILRLAQTVPKTAEGALALLKVFLDAINEKSDLLEIYAGEAGPTVAELLVATVEKFIRSNTANA